MQEYDSDKIVEMREQLVGKIISNVTVDDGMDWLFIFHFTDKTKLVVKYNCIYEWGIEK